MPWQPSIIAAVDVQAHSVLLAGFCHRGEAGPAGSGGAIEGKPFDAAPFGERLRSYLCPHDALPALLEALFHTEGGTLPILPSGVEFVRIDEQTAQRRPVLTSEPRDPDSFDPKRTGHE